MRCREAGRCWYRYEGYKELSISAGVNVTHMEYRGPGVLNCIDDEGFIDRRSSRVNVDGNIPRH